MKKAKMNTLLMTRLARRAKDNETVWACNAILICKQTALAIPALCDCPLKRWSVQTAVKSKFWLTNYLRRPWGRLFLSFLPIRGGQGGGMWRTKYPSLSPKGRETDERGRLRPVFLNSYPSTYIVFGKALFFINSFIAPSLPTLAQQYKLVMWRFLSSAKQCL